MEEPEHEASWITPPEPGEDEGLEPSWKPFYWFVGTVVALFVLGELLIDFGLEVAEFLWVVIEKAWLIVIEAPEEWLEDRLADYLKQHFPHEAERYSEIATAMGLTPLKLALILLAGRWGIRKIRVVLWPKLRSAVRRRIRQVQLAWTVLSLPQKIFAGLVSVVLLAILI